MDGNVSLFWSHLTYIPFCTDPKLWFLQPFFFGAWYWERWKQQGWSVRLVRVWSCSEFSEYRGSTLAGGSHPVVFLPSCLVTAKQAQVTLCCLSSRHRAGPVAIARLCQQGSGLPGKSQGWGRAEVKPGCQVNQTGFQICRDGARNACSSSKGPSSPVPGQTTWVRADLSTDRPEGKTAQSTFLEPLFITLQRSASGVHLYLHFPPTTLHRNKGVCKTEDGLLHVTLLSA